MFLGYDITGIEASVGSQLTGGASIELPSNKVCQNLKFNGYLTADAYLMVPEVTVDVGWDSFDVEGKMIKNTKSLFAPIDFPKGGIKPAAFNGCS